MFIRLTCAHVSQAQRGRRGCKLTVHGLTFIPSECAVSIISFVVNVT